MNIVILICFIAFGITTTSFSQEGVYKDLSVKEFQKAIADNPNAVVLDLRTPDEVKAGKIKGAIQIDYFKKDFESHIASLDKSKTYLIYCAAGGRSEETKELMQKNHFKTVYNLPEGFNGWKKAGMPVVKE
jgi:phage shock protein E